MTALVARIPNAKDRLDILHNVLGKYGNFNEYYFHRTTFKRFLNSISSKVEDLDEMSMSTIIRSYNSALGWSCTFDKLKLEIGCMGIIELIC